MMMFKTWRTENKVPGSPPCLPLPAARASLPHPPLFSISELVNIIIYL